MPLVLPAQAERLVHDYLRAHSDVAAIVGTRVAALVKDTRPCLRVRTITGTEVVPRWLDGILIQYDAFADTQGAAEILSSTTRAALWDLPGPRARGVVSGVITERIPSGDIDPLGRLGTQGEPLWVYSGDVRVYLHPNP